MPIYQPSDDSYLMSDILRLILSKKKDKSIKILDMGSGSGIQAETCKDLGFRDILVADIDPDSVKFLRLKGFTAIKTNLYSKISKKNKFDLIIFNPPYLPEDKNEPKESQIATTGGKKGYELIFKFLRQSRPHLSEDGKILLLISSLTHSKEVKQHATDLGYKIRLIKKTKIFFEELLVFELKL